MRRIFYWPREDDLPQAAVAFTAEEDDGGLNLRQVVAGLCVGVLALTGLLQTAGATEEIPPQPAVAIVEDGWQPPPPVVDRAVLYLPPDDELPAGALHGVPEDDGWAPRRAVDPPVARVLRADDGEFGVAAAAGAPEEDPWSPPVVARADVSGWRLVPDEEWVAPAVAAPAADEGWSPPVVVEGRPGRVALAPDEEWVAPAAAAPADDDAWQPAPPPWPWIVGRATIDDSDAVVAAPPPAPADELAWIPVPPLVQWLGLSLLWLGADDEITSVAAAVVIAPFEVRTRRRPEETRTTRRPEETHTTRRPSEVRRKIPLV